MIPIIISLTLMILAIGWTLYSAYKNKAERLGLPVLAAGIFCFIYVIQPIYLIWTGDIYYYLDNWQIAKAIFISFIMYLAFLFGWYFRNRGITAKKIKSKNITTKWSSKKIYQVGFALAVFGVLIFYLFIRQSGGLNVYYTVAHGAAGAWKEQTAYVYQARFFVPSGLILMILACLHSRKSVLKWMPILFFLLLLLVQSVLESSRGMFFISAMSTGIAYYLGGGKLPSLKNIIMALTIIGLIVILLVAYRGHSHLGAKYENPPTLSEAIVTMLDVKESDIEHGSTGREFLYTAGIIETLDATQNYNLGVNWIYRISIHMIPRLIWKEKPYNWQVGIGPDDIYSYFGWTRSVGSAPGIVGDIYTQFGLASILFFFILGWISKYLFLKATTENNPITIVVYTILYSRGLHLFGQGFSAIIVAYFYTLIPTIFILILYCRMRYKTADTTKANQYVLNS